jgi:hypothetical protein
MDNIVEYVASEMRKLFINYADIQPYDEFNTVRITKETVQFHNEKIIELSDILKENINGNRKPN